MRVGTPIEDYREDYGLWVKREDKACPPPGPPFSKARGVYERVRSRPEEVIGVLDTYHSQAGHAVARACQVLGKHCVNFYPEFKHEPGPRAPQLRAQALGATLHGLTAGRSAVLYHAAKKVLTEVATQSYMMPNALKLRESVEETAREAPRLAFGPTYDYVIVPASSGTIAAGVIKGMGAHPLYIVHMGYTRSGPELLDYMRDQSGLGDLAKIRLIDEEYQYKDKARPGETPPWPCNEYYDLKAFRWHQAHRDEFGGRSVLFWNVG